MHRHAPRSHPAMLRWLPGTARSPTAVPRRPVPSGRFQPVQQVAVRIFRLDVTAGVRDEFGVRDLRDEQIGVLAGAVVTGSEPDAGRYADVGQAEAPVGRERDVVVDPTVV